MPQGDDLVGLGMSPLLASTLGNDDQLLTCTGTSQATAALIKTTNVELSAASSQTGALLNVNLLIGSPVFAFCSSSTSAVIYPPNGGTLNGTLNGSFTLAQNKAAVLIQYKKGAWSSNLTA